MDVIFVSDIPVSAHPDNFHVLKMSLNELRVLAEEKLNTPVVFNSPIRLCDFKPMLGHIFEDHLQKYAYWAFGDCDVIYGNEFNVLLQEILQSDYDAISLRKQWSSGAFFALKNIPKMKVFYSRCANWREVAALSGKTFVNFDEIGNQKFYRQLEREEMTVEEATHDRDCFTAALWRATDIRFSHEDRVCEIVPRKTALTMAGGELRYLGKCLPCYHFVLAKYARCFFCDNRSYKDVGDYLVERTGFYHQGWQIRLRPVIRIWRLSSSFCRAVCARLGRWRLSAGRGFHAVF